jgi:hypothetical protein
MCTSERFLPDGTVVRLRAVPYRDPVAHELVERVQQEYVRRYGGRDAAEVDPAEFEQPLGRFLVAEVAGEPGGCTGTGRGRGPWRSSASTWSRPSGAGGSRSC